MKFSAILFLFSCVLITGSCTPSTLSVSSGINQPQIYRLPQDSLCAIAGRVTEVDSHDPVNSANIFTIGGPHGTVTDSSGNFSIRNLNAGTYRIKITSIRHESEESVEIVLKANEIAIVNIRLRQKKPVILY